jgi:hypothetical protein
MSNNIYDILKKMQGLEAPKQSLTEGKTSKPDYIDIDKDGDKKEPMKKAAKDKAKGGMAEAVARVEQQLSEKYTGFKKLEEETEQFRTIKQGAKDLGMGVADLAQGLATMATGGKVRSIDQQRADAQRREQKAIDRAAKEAGYEVGTRYHNQLVNTNPAYRDEYMSLAKDAPMGQLRNIQNQLQLKYDPMGGPMDESTVEESGLQAYLGKKKYGKEGMQALQQAGRDGASKEKMAKIRAQHDKMDEDAYNEDMLSPAQKKIASMAGDPDKIDAKDFAALRGQKKGKKTEGNKFSGNLMKARAQGLKRADLDGDGDMEPVRGGKNIDEDQVNEFDVKLRQPYGPEFNRMFGADIAGSDQDKAIISKMKPDDYVEKNKFVKDYPTDKDYQEWNRRQDVIRGKEQQDMYNYVQRYNRDNNNLSLGQWAEKGYNKLKSAVTGQPEPKTSYQSYRWDPERSQETHKDERDFPVYPNKSSTMKEGRTSMREGWEEMQKYLEKKRGPESKGGAGKKAGTRYGGSAQKDDDDEDLDGEGKPTVKKKGRPKGTGGGAKFNFKKPKD